MLTVLSSTLMLLPKLFTGLLLSLTLVSCNRFFIPSDEVIEVDYRAKGIVMKTDTVWWDGKPVFYVSTGNTTKPLLILLHGAPGSWHLNRKLLKDSILRAHFHLIAIDRPGYGRSDCGQAVTSIKKQAEAIVAVINRLGNPAVFLMGRSYGCPVAAAVAMSNPALVKGLVLVSPAVDPDLEKFWWFSPLGKWELARRLQPLAVNSATDEKYGHVQALREIAGGWSRLSCPVVAFVGLEDWIVKPENASFLEKQVPKSLLELNLMPGYDHFIADKNPILIRNTLLRIAGYATLVNHDSLRFRK